MNTHGGEQCWGGPGPLEANPADDASRRRVRVFVVGNVRLHRESLARALDDYDAVEVVGVAPADHDGLHAVVVHYPHVILIDDASALKNDIIQAMTAGGSARVVVYGVDDDDHVIRCAQHGAAGFADRTTGVEDLVATVLTVAKGEAACPAGVAAVLLKHLVMAGDRENGDERTPLTLREHQVIGLVDEGLSNKEIARQLGIEVSTVKNHIHNVLGKLRVKRRGQAAAKARRALQKWPPSRLRSVLGPLALLAGAAWPLGACKEPMPPPPPCTATVDDRCWVYLGPEDAFINAIAEVDGQLWVGTETLGILRYDASQQAWEQVAFAHKKVRSVLVVPSDDTIWAAVSGTAYPDTTSSYIYVSANGGRTWEARDGGLADSSHFGGTAGPLVIDRQDPRHLLLSYSGGVALSENSGAKWNTVLSTANTLLGYTAVAISSADSRWAWVGGGNLTFGYQLTLRSDDGGRTWHETTPPHPDGRGTVAAFLPDPDDGDVVLASSYGSVQLTNDGGATWHTVLELAHGGSYVYAFAMNDTILVAVSDEWLSDLVPGALGLYTSAAVEGLWTAVPVPVEAAAGFSVMVDRSGQLVIGTTRGVWLVRE